MNLVLERIDNVRIKNKQSVKEFCAKIEETKQTYSNWKNGRSKSYEKKLPQIAEALNCTVEYLTTGKESEAEEFYRRFTNLPENLQQAVKFIMKESK